MKLYVDLDQVLTDFVRQLSEMLGVDKDPGNDPKVWSKIDKAGEEFWSTMPWMDDGQELWGECKKHKPTILSSPSRHPSSVEGKKKWVKDNIPGTPFVPEHDKKKYAEPDAVLVDDRQKNIDAWKKAGGKGILHINAQDTIKKMREMMSEKEAAEKVIQDTQDPGRRLIIEKLRGGRGTQVIKPKKGKGSYKREKDWRGHKASCRTAAMRVVALFRDASYQEMVQEVTGPIVARVKNLAEQYEALQRKQPSRAQALDTQYDIENELSDLAWQIQNIVRGQGARDLRSIEDRIQDLEHAIIPSFEVGEFLKKAAQRMLLKYAGWWKIENVETGQIDWDQPKKKGKLINAIPGQDDNEESYNGDGPADAMDAAIDKIKDEYKEKWGRLPKRDEIQGVFNFCTNNEPFHGEKTKNNGGVKVLDKSAAHRVLMRFATPEQLEPLDNMQFQEHPVVIDPYDQIVQQAVNEMGPALKNVDVVKLEPSCPANKLAWVTNEDLYQGQPGKKRIIHLCLKKIKDKFEKKHGQSFTITDQAEQTKMKNVVKRFLMDVVLPHETEHIHQEMQHGGQFGPSSEPQAERSEEWKNLEQLGIQKKAVGADPKTLIILRGISGSGKSGLARQLENQLGTKALSTDDFFMREGKYEFDQDQVGQAHEWNIERAVNAMRQGKPVIIDNTNTQAWEMKPYVEAALKNGYDVEFREPNWSADLKDDEGNWNVNFIERLQQNPDRAQIGKAVPREILMKMRDLYEKDVDVGTIMKSKPPWEQ